MYSRYGPNKLLIAHKSRLLFTYNDDSIRDLTIKLMKGKALKKHSLHVKTAASVLLKLFISSNE